MPRLALLPAALMLAVLAAGVGARPALGAPSRTACDLTGLVRTAAGRSCAGPTPTASSAPRSDFLGVPVGRIFTTVSGKVLKTVVLGTIVSWVVQSAGAALRFTASLIGATTRPDLQSTWFSTTYWRVATISALLTLPFLFAAGIHALVRSDLSLLARAAFGYLPLAFIGVGIAAPLTMLVLAATDQASAFVAAASGQSDALFLARAATEITEASVVSQDPFIAFIVGLITVSATMALWIELLIRGAAVYVIVLMLPLFFAAMVWPARRVWAIRAVETLFALILSKFAIVAVLALGGAALSQGGASGPAALLTGATLVLLATVSPWALLRLLPLHEVAAAAAGGLSTGPRQAAAPALQIPARIASLAAGEDESDALRRLALGAGPDGGSARNGAAEPRDATDDPGDPADAMDAETTAGLAAIAGAGLGGAAAGGIRTASAAGGSAAEGSQTAPSADAAAGPRADGDGRPPIDPIFSPDATWVGFTIGDADDAMAPPRLKQPAPAPTPAPDPPPPEIASAPAPEPAPRLELVPDPELEPGLEPPSAIDPPEPEL